MHSDSWGSEVTVYDGLAASLDRFTWNNKDFLPVVAAGALQGMVRVLQLRERPQPLAMHLGILMVTRSLYEADTEVHCHLLLLVSAQPTPILIDACRQLR